MQLRSSLLEGIGLFGFICFVLFFISGCSTLDYYFQATKGQLKVFNRSKPISTVMEDNRTDEKAIEKLKVVLRAKKFAERLGLKVKGQYEKYLPWDSPYLTYLLTASPEFELKPREWEFPIVGKFPYIGFFDKSLALEKEKELQSEGFETYVRGVSAYSSIGWFSDPVPSTLFSYSDESLFNTIIHELVHATVFFKGSVDFNEQFASFVADEALRIYLKAHYGEKNEKWSEYLEKEKKSVQKNELIQKTIRDLESLYQEKDLSVEKMREKKTLLFQNLKNDLKKLSGLSAHLDSPATRGQGVEINNAFLVAHRTYNRPDPLLKEMLNRCGEDEKGLIQLIGYFKTVFESKKEKLPNLGELSVSVGFKSICSGL